MSGLPEGHVSHLHDEPGHGQVHGDHAHPHDEAERPGAHPRDEAESAHLHDGDHADSHDPAAPGGDHGHAHGEHDHDHGHAHRGGLVGFIVSIFAPHSHDASDSIDTALESSAKGIRALKISLVGLLATSGFQVAILFFTGSVALLADTIHNFSDALTAVPLWIAFVLGRRLPTKRYTYGYRRAEDLAGLFVLAMILLSSLLAAWESIDRLLHPRQLDNLGLLAIAGVIGFLGNELVAIYRIRVGQEIGSAALTADGYHARTDGLTSLAVVAGAAGVWLGFPLADPIVGLLITVAILWVLKGAAAQVLARLMDAVDPKLVDSIEQRVRAVAGVQEVSGVRVRWIGHRLEASLHATVDCEMTVAEGHDVAEAVRHELLHGIKGLDEALIHVDPCEHDGRDHHATTRSHLPEQRTPAIPARS